jgi:hypothetical protein
MKTLALLTTVLVTASIVSADYSISWYTIDGGGGTSSGGTYEISGTIGQPDAGYQDGGSYELLGGFWVGGPLCIVNFEQFATLASFWLEVSCDAGNDYCNGADLIGEDGVNIEDLKILAGEWLNVCPFGWPLK